MGGVDNKKRRQKIGLMVVSYHTCTHHRGGNNIEHGLKKVKSFVLVVAFRKAGWKDKSSKVR